MRTKIFPIIAMSLGLVLLAATFALAMGGGMGNGGYGGGRGSGGYGGHMMNPGQHMQGWDNGQQPGRNQPDMWDQMRNLYRWRYQQQQPNRKPYDNQIPMRPWINPQEQPVN